MIRYRAALARTIRYISDVGCYGFSYTQEHAGCTLAGYCDAPHGREMHLTAPGFCKSRSGDYIVASGASVYAFSPAQQPTALGILSLIRCIIQFLYGWFVDSVCFPCYDTDRICL